MSILNLKSEDKASICGILAKSLPHSNHAVIISLLFIRPQVQNNIRTVRFGNPGEIVVKEIPLVDVSPDHML